MSPAEQGEEFRQFQAGELRRQTVASERTARDVGTIKTILLVWAILTLIGAVMYIAALASQS